MKKISSLLAALSISAAAQAQSTVPVNFTWQNNPENEGLNVLGSRLWWGPESRNYTNFITLDPLATNTSLMLPSGARIYSSIMNFNDGHESEFSNEEIVDVPLPAPPYGIVHGYSVRVPRTIFNYTCEQRENGRWKLMRSRNLVTWEQVAELTSGTNKSVTVYQVFPVSFFKLKYE